MAVGLDFSFPDVLLQPAKCLVGLTGLDVRNNAVHMAIWDLFKGARRGDRKPVAYKQVTADHLYPRKTKAVASEDPLPPSPSGILKLGWIRKHTNEIPAVVVFFFDLDWSHPQWEEKVTECASKVQVIRSSLDGHATELCVALIQSVRPNPTGPDQQTADQANQLCIACSLSSPNLFIMPFVERPNGYVNRLETAFFELAVRYYGNQAKKIRVIREVGKPQQLLAIRRQFKLAFFTEMKQDYKEALRLYSLTYKYITDVMWLSEDRIMEFKMIAGFVNYKICRFMFEDDPRNALNQLNRFMEMFRKEKGPYQLLFQHLEWTANQYMAFGDLFADAVRKNLRPVQTQHPGIHYYQAVLNLLERRKLKEKLCKESVHSLQNPVSLDIPLIEYIGQRPWRVGLTDSQPSGSQLREKAIAMMQIHESNKDISYQIILLVSNALHHFKQLEHRADHMINHLKVLLGEEYYLTHDYEKSLALLRAALKDYRTQQWWKILSHILQTMLTCAYAQGLANQYVSICLEFISRFVPVLKKEKLRVQENLLMVLKGQFPHPEPNTDQSQDESTIQELWTKNLDMLKSGNSDDERENVITMSSIAACVECKTWFTEHSYSGDQVITLKIYLRSSSPLPLSINKIQVLFDHEPCNEWCILDEEIILEPGHMKQVIFEFPIISDTLQVLSVEAHMGPFKLVWREGTSGRNFEPKDWHWNKIKNRTSTLILQREPKISLSARHQPPILLSENYPLSVCVKNEEEREIKDIVIFAVLLLDHQKTTQGDNTPSIRLYSSHPPSSSLSAPPSPRSDSHYCIEMSCNSIPVGEEYEATFYIKSHSIGSQKINISVHYSVDCLVREGWELIKCKCQKEESVSLETVTPLRISHRILNMKFQPQDCTFISEPFIVQTNIHCLSPWKIILTNAKYQWNQSVTTVTNLPDQLNGTTLCQQEIASNLQCVQVDPPNSFSSPSDIQLSLGSYVLQWRREGEGGSENATATVQLPHVNTRILPYSISIDIPASATQRELVTITYKLTNKTIYVQEFDIQLSASNDFMCSGNRTMKFRVLPLTCFPFSFNLFPLNVGHIHLPQLDITCVSQPKLDEQVLKGVSSNLPLSIFVMPAALEKTSDSPQSSMGNSLPSSVTTSV